MKLIATLNKTLIISIFVRIIFLDVINAQEIVTVTCGRPCNDSTVRPECQRYWRTLPLQQQNNNPLLIRGGGIVQHAQHTLVKLKLSNTAFTSLLAGSFAGVIGLGVAFPLDTLKTRTQVMISQTKVSGLVVSSSRGSNAAGSLKNSIGILQLIRLIYKAEGICGFYGGVRGMMVGQAVIKSVAFSVNAIGLKLLQQMSPTLTETSTLLLAACFSGFITSFLVNPIERIKVMMQTHSKGNEGDGYGNEIKCIQVILKNEGLFGLLGRGLTTTLAREVPSYGVYFFVYGFLSRLPLSQSIGALAPLVNGALSGMASWLPVYPVDVVKTLLQNTDGITENVSSIGLVKELYAEVGIGAFFDGLTPTLLKAAVQHAVTFFVYDKIVNTLTR